jgi:hypothetical protein
MSPLSCKRLAVALSITAVILAVLAAWGWARTVMSEVHATLADGWTELLEEGRGAALKSTNVMEVADTLRWVGRFYRPPEPPRSGIERHHYNLMERVRVCYQEDIIIHLREMTGDHLGDDPEPWIEKYAKPE